MNKIRVVVVGGSHTDMLIRFAPSPTAKESNLGGAFSMAAGGKGANQAVAAARAGGTVTLVACVGRDIFGDQALAGLKANKIEIDHVARHPTAKSGVALFYVDQKSGENCMAAASGVSGELSVADVAKAEKAISNSRIVILQLEIPLAAVKAAAALAVEAGVRVILNPAPAQKLPDSLLRQVSVFTPNAIEAEFYSGIRIVTTDDARRAAEKLIVMGVEIVIITLGARGSFVATREDARLIPGFAITPVDTTGAGDVYNGALAVALAEGKNIFEAATFANAAAAIAATRLGAHPSAPNRADIEAMVAGAYKSAEGQAA